MIPKIIHYCWFGGKPLPKLAKKCIASWKKYCPDYEIKEWNEKNFDINCNDFVKEAYKAKKWAFVTDYARLEIIYNCGGIYLDTDVELIRPLDSFLNNTCFMALEKPGFFIATGLGFGAEINNCVIKELQTLYNSITFPDDDNYLNSVTCPIITTDFFERYGFKKQNITQDICGVKIYSTDFFCPKDYYTRETRLTKNTVAIHHYDGSWLLKSERLKAKIKALLGPKNTANIKSIKNRLLKRSGITEDRKKKKTN